MDPHFSNVGKPHWPNVKGIWVAHFSIAISSRCHVLVECPFRPLPSCRFVAFLFSVTTLSVTDLGGKEWSKPLCFR